MKDEAYSEIICKKSCRYYKEGREELHCAGYLVLIGNLTINELGCLFSLLSLSSPGVDLKNQMPPETEELKNLLCKRCDFFTDGCDYCDNRSGPPCGGYLLLYAFTASNISFLS